MPVCMCICCFLYTLWCFVELGETDELCQKLGQDRVELLKEMKQLETELWGELCVCV